MVELLDAAHKKGLELDSTKEMTPADLAVQVWLQDQAFRERKHAEQYLLNPKSFEHYIAEYTEAVDRGLSTAEEAASYGEADLAATSGRAWVHGEIHSGV